LALLTRGFSGAVFASLTKEHSMSDLTSKAMLTSLSVAYWTGKAHDEDVVTEIVAKHASSREMHEYKKVLVQPSALQPIKALRSKARSAWMTATCPWIDGGTRVLPATKYLNLAEELREIKAEYEAAVKFFLDNYPKYKTEAKKRLNGLYKEEDYPTRDELLRKFGFDMNVFPIPSDKDWRVDLGKEANAEVKKQIASQVKSAEALILKSVWEKMSERVALIADYLKDESKTVKAVSVRALREMLADVPEFNMTGDPEIEKMRARIGKELAGISVDTMNSDKKERAKTAKTADDILKVMAGYIGS
jgi:hypothetical protein